MEKNEKDNPYNKKSAQYYTLGILTVIYALNIVDRQLLAILQDSIKAELDLMDWQLGLLSGFAFALFYVTAGIPIARWADKGNRRNIIGLAVGLWSLMTAICGLALNYLHLLLARIGVGVGEAGCSPPAHSMISDIFPPERRVSSMAIYNVGLPVGMLFGFLAGGWLNEAFSWRVAFIVVGLPGVFLALFFLATVKEPIRGWSENRQLSPATEASFRDVLKVLWSRAAFRHISIAGALTAVAGYSTANWVASFMIRSHGMSTGELGTWLAGILGLGGAIGIFFVGTIAERLARIDVRWHMWLPGLIAFVNAPLLAGCLVVDNTYLALGLLILPGSLFSAYLASSIAMAHGMVGLRMRAVASAILFLILNIVGLGFGSWSVGVLSDVLMPAMGNESLRYAMLYLLPAALAWSGIHFLFASRHLKHDLARAPA